MPCDYGELFFRIAQSAMINNANNVLACLQPCRNPSFIVFTPSPVASNKPAMDTYPCRVNVGRIETKSLVARLYRFSVTI
jgi:hypothetical protein